MNREQPQPAAAPAGELSNNVKKTVNKTPRDAGADYLSALGQRIADIANMRGGKRALARSLGIHESMLYRYINGDNALSVPMLVALATAGNVDIAWLATGSGIAQPTSKISESRVAAYRSRVPACDAALSSPLDFDAAWLQQLCGACPDEVCLLEMRGEAMEPTLRSGDLLLIDKRVSKVDQDGLYAVRAAALEIKRIQKRPAGALRLGSDNPNCKSTALTRAAAGRLAIVGRVVWFGRRL